MYLVTVVGIDVTLIIGMDIAEEIRKLINSFEKELNRYGFVPLDSDIIVQIIPSTEIIDCNPKTTTVVTIIKNPDSIAPSDKSVLCRRIEFCLERSNISQRAVVFFFNRIWRFFYNK